MISIASYAKGKKSSSSSGNGGGGFANTVIKNTNGISPFYLWGQYVDGRDSINGDLISNGTINGNKLVAPQGDIDLINALSEYVNYISGHTAIFDNLSGDTAHFNQDVFVGGDIDIEGDTNIGGDTVIEGDLSVSGDTHLTNLWTQNITNSDTIKTKNLEVSGLAHFFQLVIDRIKAAGGGILLTPADGFETALVEEDASGYTLYFHAKDGEKQISNMWEVNDQAICQTFNASTGTSYNVSNTYYWALVTEVSEQAVEKTVSGVTNEYHYIKLSKSVYDGELNPKVGDEIAMLGSRNDEDPQRQSAIYLSAYVSLDQGLTAPLFAEYKCINDFSLSSHRHSYIDATGASFTGDFRIDNNTTIQDYVNSATTEVRNEFRFDTEGLYSRVSKMTNPNILPANGWTDQDDKALLQEDDEEFIFEEPQEESLAKGGFSEEVVDEDYIGIPPVIYLNADTYTFSTYSHVKYEDIQYGQAKDNLNLTLPVQTTFISGDTWHNEERAVTTFIAPIDGYYKFGAKMMDSSYTGDYEWVEPEDEGGSGHSPSESAITTTIKISMEENIIYRNTSGNKATASITPSSFSGTVIWNSSDTSVATVDQEGKITAIQSGTTTISATIPEQYWNGNHYLGSSDSIFVTVEKYAPVESPYFVIQSVNGNPTVTVNKNGSPTGSMSYRKNGTGNWTNITTTTNISTQEGDYLEFKGNIDNYTGTKYWSFSTNKESSIVASGYLMALNKNTEISNSNNAIGSAHFCWLFQSCNGLISAKHLKMPIGTFERCYLGMFKDCTNLIDSPQLYADYLSENSYSQMFYGCTSLTQAPALPAKNLGKGCYSLMFNHCSSLTQAPELPATTCPWSCYSFMFNGCSSLTQAPELPATTVELFAYSNMFKDCTSLVNPPSILPATTIGEYSYNEMFMGCTSLKKCPIISAITLGENSCEEMFSGCTSLVIGPELPATTLTSYSYRNMFSSCSSLTSLTVGFNEYDSSTKATKNWLSDINTVGTLYCPADALYSENDISLPSGWTLSKTLQPVYPISSQTISFTSIPQSGLTVGDNFNLNASTTPDGGALSYSSSNPSVASVDCDGIVSALTRGTANITINTSAYHDNVNHIHYSSASTSVNVEVLGIPNILTDSPYFVIKSVSGNPTVTVNKNGSPTGSMSYRKNGNGNWTTVSETTSISTQEGDYLEFKGDIINSSVSNYYAFSTDMPNSIEAGGYLMALNKNTEIDESNNTIEYGLFKELFYNCSGLTSAENLIMPNDVTDSCFVGMFEGCRNLIRLPYLPAITLERMCYYKMFAGCSSLTQAPELIATTLAWSCYQYMFASCSSLTQAPELIATTLANACYQYMFSQCSNLSNLNIRFSDFDSSMHPIDRWLYRVTTQGTPYCPSNATYSASDLGLPNTWTLSKTL